MHRTSPVLRRCRDSAGSLNRGSLSVELAFFAPVIIMMMMLALLAHRFATSQIDLQTAAHAAARAATAEVDAAAAHAAATTVAEAMRPTWCTAYAIATDIGSLEPGSTVAVTLTCTTEAVTLFGSRALTAAAASPVDQWRPDPAGAP